MTTSTHQEYKTDSESDLSYLVRTLPLDELKTPKSIDVCRALAIEALEYEIGKNKDNPFLKHFYNNLDPYSLISLGSGGEAHVFSLNNSEGGDPLALKLIRNKDDSLSPYGSIPREKDVMYLLGKTPHIPVIRDTFQYDGIYAIMMSRVGKTKISSQGTKTFLSPDPITDAINPNETSRILNIYQQIAQVVEEKVHQKGIVHRDIKPDNVLVLEDMFWVFDFGIAGVLPDGLHNDSIRHAGTLEYCAPETLDGKIDPRSDIFSLCLMLYESFTGKSLLKELIPNLEHPMNKLAPLCTGQAKEHVDQNRAIPTLVKPIITQGISLYPKDRQSTIGDVSSQLKHSLKNIKT